MCARTTVFGAYAVCLHECCSAGAPCGVRPELADVVDEMHTMRLAERAARVSVAKRADADKQHSMLQRAATCCNVHGRLGTAE